MFDTLESRRLLSIALNGTTLNITSSSGNDKVIVSQGVRIYAILNSAIQSFALSSVKKVYISTGGGQDKITLDKTLKIPASVYGGAGDDSIIADSPAADFYSGGAGVNYIDYSDRSEDLKLSTNNLADDGAANEHDNIQSDFIVVTGGTGNDTIDIHNLALGNVHGNKGNDTLKGATQGDIDGGEGDDEMIGGSGANTFYGGDGNDTADYAARTDNLSITIDNVANDGAKNEHDDVREDVESIFGGNGNDYINTAETGNFYVLGFGGNDTIYSHYGDDTIAGGDGNDLLDGGLNPDVIQGGPGNDTVTYASRKHSVFIHFDNNYDSGEGSYKADNQQLIPAEGDRLSADIETIYGGSGDDSFFGDGRPSLHFYGFGGKDYFNPEGSSNCTLDGGDGDDQFDVSSGSSNLMIGGAGEDTAEFYSAPKGVNISDDGLANDGTPGQNDNIGTDVEELVGSPHDDTITGNSKDNVLFGYVGNDTINGAAGNDTLETGGGNDVLIGGSGIDTASWAGQQYAVHVSLDDQPNDGGVGETANVTSTVENVTGGSGNDLIVGSSTNNSLLGGGGDDTIVGGAGTDTMDGQDGTDTVDYSDRAAAVNVSFDNIANDGVAGENDILSHFENMTGGSGNDTLAGDDNANSISGGAGDDSILGNGGNDTLHGGDGNDTLTGGGGNDKLYGDAGHDKLFAKDGSKDTLNGGGDSDTIGDKDSIDSITSVP